MRLIRQSFAIEDLGARDGDAILEKIEAAGRTCYKSEGAARPGSARAFVKRILERGHHSVIEHHSVTARIETNRGVTHEIVRHRLAAYSQESTRYCNYGSDDVAFIVPVWWPEATQESRDVFLRACGDAEREYKSLLELGWSPQMAREVLPNALKTEIVVTANLREWRHIFQLRCSKAAHPQMRQLMWLGLIKMNKAIPVLFDDLVDFFVSKEEMPA